MNWKAALILSLLFLTAACTATILGSDAPRPRLQGMNTRLTDDTLPTLQGEPIDSPGGPH